MAKAKAPFRRVIESDHQTGGKSIFKSGLPLGGIWVLTLECGHIVQRPCYYFPPNADEHPRRGWYRRRRASAVKPAPQRVHCEKCRAYGVTVKEVDNEQTHK